MTLPNQLPNRQTVRRRGLSLIELLVAFAVGSILLGLAVGGFRSLMQFDRRFSDSRSEWSQHARLVETLRADAHQSTRFREDATEDADQPAWIFGDGDREVARYTFASGRCLRTVAGADDDRSLFGLQENAKWTASTKAADAGELVELQLSFAASPSTPAKEYSVEILLGRDAQLAKEPAR